jgi:hypothetical protein
MGVSEESVRAGIHRRRHHEAGWISNGGRRTGSMVRRAKRPLSD